MMFYMCGLRGMKLGMMMVDDDDDDDDDDVEDRQLMNNCPPMWSNMVGHCEIPEQNRRVLSLVNETFVNGGFSVVIFDYLSKAT